VDVDEFNQAIKDYSFSSLHRDKEMFPIFSTVSADQLKYFAVSQHSPCQQERDNAQFSSRRF